MSEPICGNCRFWGYMAARPDGARIGLCRRFPPVRTWPVVVQPNTGLPMTVDTLFPPLSEEGWCGEHQPEPKS